MAVKFAAPKRGGNAKVVCKKLDPNLFTCQDHPGVRCVAVPLGQCRHELVESAKPKREAP